MSNLVVRAIAGTVFVIVVVLGVWLSSISMLLLFFLITSLGLWEFSSLLEQAEIKVNKTATLLANIVVWQFLSPFRLFGLEALLLFPAVLLTIELFSKNKSPLSNVTYSLYGMLYIVLPFFLMAYQALNFYTVEGEEQIAYFPYLILGAFILIWSNDTFAYLSGRLFGKTKLFERISPNKTQEGAYGGSIFTIIAAIVIAQFFTEYTWRDWVIIALIVSVLGTIGDLVESMFKRSLNIKDSGSIIPGHGGILDRFDSFVFSAPFVYFYVTLLR